MRRVFVPAVAAAVLAACGASSTYLEPPASRANSDAIVADMHNCHALAYDPRPLTDAERARIAGYETARLLYRGVPVIGRNGRPTVRESMVPQPADLIADRYAICLLERDYTWQTR